MCHWSSRVQNCGHNKSEGAGTSRILKQMSWCCHPARLPERLFQLPLLQSTCPLPVAMPLLPFVTCSWTQWSKLNKPGLICTQLSGWCYKRWFTACRNSTRRAKKVVGENVGLALSACPEGDGQKRVALGWCEHQCAEFSAVLCWTWQEANLSVPAGFTTQCLLAVLQEAFKARRMLDKALVATAPSLVQNCGAGPPVQHGS